MKCRHCGRSRYWHRLLRRRGDWRLYCLPPDWDKPRASWTPRQRPRESFTPAVAGEVRSALTRPLGDEGEQGSLI